MAETESFSGAHVRDVNEVFAGFIGAFFAMRLMTTLALGKFAGADPQVGSAVRLALTFVFAAIVWILWMSSSRKGELLRLGRPLRWVYGYLALCGVSLVWTQAVSPAASAVYYMGTVAEVCIALLLLGRDAEGRNAEQLMKGFICGAVLVAVIAWLMPTQYDLRLGDEDYFNSNTIAYVCAFGALLTQFLMRGRSKWWGAVLALLVMTVLRSLSKTTMIAFALSEAFILIQDRSMSRRAKAWLMFAAGAMLLLFWGLFVAYYNFYTNNGNQAETLTGRTGIWLWAWSAAIERPWFGHGFDAMWKVAPRFGTFEARHAENEFLQQFYCFGVAGVAIVVWLYASLWRAVRRAAGEPRRVVLPGMIVFVLVRGLAEAEAFDLQLPLWMVVLLLALLAQAAKASREPALVPVLLPDLAPNVIRL